MEEDVEESLEEHRCTEMAWYYRLQAQHIRWLVCTKIQDTADRRNRNRNAFATHNASNRYPDQGPSDDPGPGTVTTTTSTGEPG